MEIISRAEAKASSLKFYFTGKPCDHGHISERRTTTKKCRGCEKAELERGKVERAERRKLLPPTPPTPREMAIAAGKAQYFTGKPCPKGHIANRSVYSSRCMECQREWVEANREKCNGYSAKWRAENPDKAADVLVRFREKHRKVLLERARKAYAKNPEKERARTKRWREKNPEGVRAHAMTRWALKKGSSGSYTAQDVQDLLVKQKGKCVNCLCDVRKKFHVDHIKPLSRGGPNVKSNLQILCPKCNISKHAKDPIDWAQENGRLL